jgi:hypothetical protein
MIYCVVPEALADELLEKLTVYYADDPNVTVIVERRQADRRGRHTTPPDDATSQMRQIRDRRRARIPGDFPAIEPGS